MLPESRCVVSVSSRSLLLAPADGDALSLRMQPLVAMVLSALFVGRFTTPFPMLHVSLAATSDRGKI